MRESNWLVCSWVMISSIFEGAESGWSSRIRGSLVVEWRLFF